MLALQEVDTGQASTTWQVVKRRVPLSQSDGVMAGVQAGKEIAEAPNTTGIGGKTRELAVLPQFLEVISRRAGGSQAQGGMPSGIEHFEEVTAARATKILVGMVGNAAAVDAP